MFGNVKFAKPGTDPPDLIFPFWSASEVRLLVMTSSLDASLEQACGKNTLTSDSPEEPCVFCLASHFFRPVPLLNKFSLEKLHPLPAPLWAWHPACLCGLRDGIRFSRNLQTWPPVIVVHGGGLCDTRPRFPKVIATSAHDPCANQLHHGRNSLSTWGNRAQPSVDVMLQLRALVVTGLSRILSRGKELWVRTSSPWPA